MKRILLTTIGLFGLAMAGPVTAADIAPSYKAPPPPRPACAQFRGFYVGANAGYAYHDKRWTDRDAWVDNFGIDWALGTAVHNDSGVTGGLQAGYNWQRNCTVFGFEADISWADLKDTRIYAPAQGVAVTVLELRDNLKYWGTVRTRTGVVVDDLLLYVTGGLAYARINHDFTVTDPTGAPTSETFSAKSSRWGWTAGLGVEWAWTSNISIKSEVLYVKFNDVLTEGISPNGAATGERVRFDNQDSMWVTRIGVNWRFGGAPLYARY